MMINGSSRALTFAPPRRTWNGTCSWIARCLMHRNGRWSAVSWRWQAHSMVVLVAQPTGEADWQAVWMAGAHQGPRLLDGIAARSGHAGRRTGRRRFRRRAGPTRRRTERHDAMNLTTTTTTKQRRSFARQPKTDKEIMSECPIDPHKHHYAYCLPFGAHVVGTARDTPGRVIVSGHRRAKRCNSRSMRTTSTAAAALIDMEPTGDGWFEAEADGGAGTRYRYRLDENLAVPDPASRFQPDDVHGPSEVIDPRAYRWEQHELARPAVGRNRALRIARRRAGRLCGCDRAPAGTRRTGRDGHRTDAAQRFLRQPQLGLRRRAALRARLVVWTSRRAEKADRHGAWPRPDGVSRRRLQPLRPGRQLPERLRRRRSSAKA